MIYDICIIGTGAGAGPIAYEMALSGKKVVMLEKGPWIKTDEFTKDEMVATRRHVYTPNPMDEPQVIEQKNALGAWEAQSTYKSGANFWNGSVVGGSSNFMSGYFARLKPKDFKLLTAYGEIEGANMVDWPISYNDIEPFYTKTEHLVGISGKVVPHAHLEPRSTSDFPFPPLAEHPVSSWLDLAAQELNYELLPLPRAILSRNSQNRRACSYSNYCGSYGCATDAKGSSRAALLHEAIKSGNCKIIPNAKAFFLETNGKGKVIKAWYYFGKEKKSIEAQIFVVAAQAIESCRLLLMSKNKDFPKGLANNYGQVGKNLIFSGGGIGSGNFLFRDFSDAQINQLKVNGLFINRTLQQWIEYPDPENGRIMKGGSVDFLFEHANAISKAIKQKWGKNQELIYGSDLKNKISFYFKQQRKLNFEVFTDWLPTDNCFVQLSGHVSDKWGDPVAHIRIDSHPQNQKTGRFIANKAEELLRRAGAKNVSSNINGSAPSNLQAGGCRFGNKPENSVLDINCKAHETENLYVTDGSFMPTGGSVPLTWTIYANSFRVANHLKNII